MTTSADLAHVRDVAAADRPAAARWAWLAARQRTWLSALLIVIFSALVLPPFVLLVQGSLTVGSTGVSDGQWGFGNFEAVLRSRHFVELLARSSIPPTALQLIATALNAEPVPPADPAVVALLDTAGEHAILTRYTRTDAGAAVPRSRNQ